MGSIHCPYCKALISSPLVDVLEGGGELLGAGGLICAGCGAKLRHEEIRRQFLAEQSRPRTSPAGSSCFGVLAVCCMLAAAVMLAL